jgi:L-asparaginase
MIQFNTTKNLHRVALVATGGTIAGMQVIHDGYRHWQYESAKLSGENLLEALPALLDSAIWHFEQPYHIASQNLTLRHMLQLRAVLIRLLCSTNIDGIIVTHGTDTMEDILFFLHLTLPSDCLSKPLLFTGAMLPSDHDEADGPANISRTFDFLIKSLLQINQVDSDFSAPFGLLMNEFFTPAYSVTKHRTVGFNAFNGSHSILPEIECVSPAHNFNKQSELKKQGKYAYLFDIHETQHSLFEAMEVPVVYCSPGNGPLRQLNDLLNHRPASIVLAAPGHGNIPNDLIPLLRRHLLNGVSVIRASRVAEGGVIQGGEFNSLNEFRENISPKGCGIFYESGNLSLNQSVIEARLRKLALSLAI